MLTKILTYSGTLPLMASVVLAQLSNSGITASLIATTYSAVIISFLSGIHFAVYLFFAEKCPRHLLIISNAVALSAWVSLLAAPPPTVILLQVLCFLYLLTLDIKLLKAGILPEWFFTLRRNATIIVVVCLSFLMVR